MATLRRVTLNYALTDQEAGMVTELVVKDNSYDLRVGDQVFTFTENQMKYLTSVLSMAVKDVAKMEDSDYHQSTNFDGHQPTNSDGHQPTNSDGHQPTNINDMNEVLLAGTLDVGINGIPTPSAQDELSLYFEASAEDVREREEADERADIEQERIEQERIEQERANEREEEARQARRQEANDLRFDGVLTPNQIRDERHAAYCFFPLETPSVCEGCFGCGGVDGEVVAYMRRGCSKIEAIKKIRIEQGGPDFAGLEVAKDLIEDWQEKFNERVDARDKVLWLAPMRFRMNEKLLNSGSPGCIGDSARRGLESFLLGPKEDAAAAGCASFSGSLRSTEDCGFVCEGCGGLPGEVVAFIRNGCAKLAAIKELRSIVDVSLLEAKNLIEAWQKSFNSVVGVDDQVVWQQYIPSGGQ